MKKSLKHLPQKKRDELKNIAAIICKKCDDVEMIVLFGSYARGDYREPQDVMENKPGLRKVSDYDILVVTGTEKSGRDLSLWARVSRFCEENGLKTYVNITAHDIETLNVKLSEGQYFFSDAKEEGIVLYDSKKFKLAEKRKLTNKEQGKISQKYFDEYFQAANTFFLQYKNALKIGDSKNSSFQLHQAAEHAYKCIISVFSNGRHLPKDHFLTNLACRVNKFHSELKTLFSQKNRREEKRFETFEYAYIGARYDPDFMMLKADQEILDQDVKKLIGITKEICEAKIKEFLQ